MLGALAPDGARGRVFGFHRAMDHAGAVVGPLAASAFLWAFPGEYRTLFALTIVPGALALLALSVVPEVRSQQVTATTEARGLAATEVDPLSPPLKRFLIILSIFTLGNSTDAFLLLRLTDAGLAAVYLPVAWAGLHVVKSSLSTAGGGLSDRLGRTRLIAAGWALYAIVYAGFAESTTLTCAAGVACRVRRALRARRGQRKGARRRPDAGTPAGGGFRLVQRCAWPRRTGVIADVRRAVGHVGIAGGVSDWCEPRARRRRAARHRALTDATCMREGRHSCAGPRSCYREAEGRCWEITCIAVVIMPATSARLAGRMTVSSAG